MVAPGMTALRFIIADSFTDSLARLGRDEQKAIKTTAFDLQVNPANPGLQFHKLDKAKDKNFWSVRVNSDIRLIVHRTPDSLLLYYVDHHDQAYEWAERRKLETHPATGAAQFVEFRERVEDVVIPRYVTAVPSGSRKRRLFADLDDDELLGYGVPPEWLAAVREVDEHGLLDLAVRLPAEAAEALLELATGGLPEFLPRRELPEIYPAAMAEGAAPASAPASAESRAQSVTHDRAHVGTRASSDAPEAPSADAFGHPDAQRRFRVITGVEELERALAFPWDKWTVFLHPEQREIIERDYAGPVRVSGSAGTGKTVVALHRAAFLASSHPDSRILLTTFSAPLAASLQAKLRRLISNEPRLGERLEVLAIEDIGERLYARTFGAPKLASREMIRTWIEQGASEVEGQFSVGFMLSEWHELVDAWQLDTWEQYRDVTRLGRKTRLPEARRAQLWTVFEGIWACLGAEGLVTHAGMFARLTKALATRTNRPFDFVVVDESQDLSPAQLRFLAAMGGDRVNGLFFAGDLGQRIFRQPFSWKSVGVDIRGRCRTLHINYRTSHQIRRQADRLLAPELADVDGNAEARFGTISVFNGPVPSVRTFATEETESIAAGSWLAERRQEDIAPHEIGIFVRCDAQLPRACAAAAHAGLPFKILDEGVQTAHGHVTVSTMHLAKGLEFRAVAVMACDDEVLPLQSRIETAGEESELRDVYDTERQLLYVACTRARDQLLVTAVEPHSEFLDDFGDGAAAGAA